jgi:ATP-dependent Clp protease ATP-binding subunit ClpA
LGPGKVCDLLQALLAIDGGRSGPSDPGEDEGGSPAPPSGAPTQRFWTGADVGAATCRLTGLPEFLVVPTVPVCRADLRRFLEARVVAQRHVLEPLIDRIQMVKAGLCAPGRPIAAYLFAGPSGVGKTLVARTLAALLLGDERRLIRFDMSEFCAIDSVSRFLGEQRRWGRTFGLVDAVMGEVFPVILLDEIEKAHRAVLDVLLQALGEGRISDESHRTAHLTNAIVIMTSNLGTDSASIEHPRPPAASAEWTRRVRDGVRRHFRPEFLNRLTDVFTFLPLSPDEAGIIAEREIGRLAARRGLTAREIVLRLSQRASEAVLHAGYSPQFGVRPMERAIDALVGTAVGRFLAENPGAARCRLTVDVADGPPDVAAADETTPSVVGRPVDRLVVLPPAVPFVPASLADAGSAASPGSRRPRRWWMDDRARESGGSQAGAAASRAGK